MSIAFWHKGVPVETTVERASMFGRSATNLGSRDLLVRVLGRSTRRSDDLSEVWKILRDLEATDEELVWWVLQLPADYYDILTAGELSWLWRVYVSRLLPPWVEPYELNVMDDYVGSHYLLFIHLTRLSREARGMGTKEYIRLLTREDISARIYIRRGTYSISESTVREIGYSSELDTVYRNMDGMVGTISYKRQVTPSVLEHIIFLSRDYAVPHHDLLTVLAAKLFDYVYTLSYGINLCLNREFILAIANSILRESKKFLRPNLHAFLSRYWGDYSGSVMERLVTDQDMTSINTTKCRCTIL
jgi:hypothetical protein